METNKIPLIEKHIYSLVSKSQLYQIYIYIYFLKILHFHLKSQLYQVYLHGIAIPIIGQVFFTFQSAVRRPHNDKISC